MLGINVGRINYWAPNFIYNNFWKGSREFFATDDSAFPVDANGYPTQIKSGQVIRSSLFTSVGGLYPAGPFVFEYDGEGTFKFSGDAIYADGLVSVVPSNTGILIDLTSTNPDNPLRNFRLYQQGGSPDGFYQPFLDDHKGYQQLRFMRVGGINQGYHAVWDDRPTPDSQTQGGLKGMCLEDMIDLCNTLDCHLHLSFHHGAEKDEIAGTAELIKARLNEHLTVTPEESNEVWNGGMPNQANYHTERGLSMGLSDNKTTAKMLSHAEKTGRIGEIMKPILGDRVMVSLGAMAGNSWHVSKMLEYLTSVDLAQYIDVVTVAYYLAGDLGKAANQANVEKMTVDDILDVVEADIEIEEKNAIRPNIEAALKYGKRVIIYEGGPHLKAGGSAQNNAKVVSLFNQCGVHERMQGIVKRLLENWDEICLEYYGETMPFNFFEDCSPPSKFGDFGAKRNLFQSGTPKFNALRAHLGEAVSPIDPVEQEPVADVGGSNEEPTTAEPETESTDTGEPEFEPGKTMADYYRALSTTYAAMAEIA